MEVLWAFSIYLEVAAPLPQLFVLQRQEEVEGITIRYLIALAGHRVFYLLNWIYRYALYFLTTKCRDILRVLGND